MTTSRPRNFVVHVLERFFDMDSETALATMLRVGTEERPNVDFICVPRLNRKSPKRKLSPNFTATRCNAILKSGLAHSK